MPKMKITHLLTSDDGKKYIVEQEIEATIQEETKPTPQPEPEPKPEPQPEPEQSTNVDIPLSYTDKRFASNSNAGATRVPSGGTIENKTITDTGNLASIVTSDGATIRNCRVNSREAVRIGGSGVFRIENCWLEAKGTGDDHADTIQAYSPGSRGSLVIRNTTVRAHNQAATAGLFIADNWTGTIDVENVVFWGGPFGARIHPDVGGNNTIRFKNVYFVGPFGYKPMMFSNYGGKSNNIELWENVRHATIENGKLVPGAEISKP